MTLVLHGAWLPDQKKFFLWGESLNAVPLKGKPPKRPPHPFQSSVEKLRERVAIADSTTHTLNLWLPSTTKTPIPSPELIAAGAVAPKDSPKLTAWRTTGLLLSVNAAFDFLLALPTHHIGADLLATFYHAGDDLYQIAPNIAAPEIESPLLKRLGASPANTHTDLQLIYEAMMERAQGRVFAEQSA
jgi:hypothetical protein